MIKTRILQIEWATCFLIVAFSFCLFATSDVVGQEVKDANPVTQTAVVNDNSGLTVTAGILEKNSPDLPVILTLTVVNQGEKPIDYTIAGQVNWRVKVTDMRTGQDVPVTRYGSGALGGGISRFAEILNPGDSFSQVIVLSRLYDLTLEGYYRVTVSRTFNEFSIYRINKDESITIKLVPLEFTVMEPITVTPVIK